MAVCLEHLRPRRKLGHRHRWPHGSRALGKNGLTAGELAAKADVSIATVYNILSGRAQNPNPRTIASLERVLGEKFESKSETQEASRIDGIGQLIDFDPYDQKDLPAKPGVYVFYDISGRPIYVGKSGNIATRFKDHEDRFWVRRPIVETAAYVEIPDSATRDQVETVLIQFLNNNAVMNKNRTVRNSN